MQQEDFKTIYEITNTPFINGKINCFRTVKENHDLDPEYLKSFTPEYFDNLKRALNHQDDLPTVQTRKEEQQPCSIEDELVELVMNTSVRNNQKTQSSPELSEPIPLITKLPFKDCSVKLHSVYQFAWPEFKCDTFMPLVENLNLKYQKKRQISSMHLPIQQQQRDQHPNQPLQSSTNPADAKIARAQQGTSHTQQHNHDPELVKLDEALNETLKSIKLPKEEPEDLGQVASQFNVSVI